VLYHGNKGVQYSIMNPVITSFKPGTIDYASSDVMEFSLTLEYESFTTYSTYNFDLSGEDLDRFEKIELLEENNDLFGDRTQSIPGLVARDNTSLSSPRSRQPTFTEINRPLQPEVGPPAPNETPLLGQPRPTYGANITFDGSGRGSRNPFSDILEGVIDSGIGAAIHGSSIKDAVLGTAVRGTTRIIGNAINEAIQAGQNPQPGSGPAGSTPPINPTGNP
jgi:hypothetical protein